MGPTVYYIVTAPVWLPLGLVWALSSAVQTFTFEALLRLHVVDEKWR